MRGYCQREVEPMGRESEQLHVTALTEALGLRVLVQYLDGRWGRASALCSSQRSIVLLASRE